MTGAQGETHAQSQSFERPRPLLSHVLCPAGHESAVPRRGQRDLALKMGQNKVGTNWVTVSKPMPRVTGTWAFRMCSTHTHAQDYCIIFLVEVKILKALFPQLKAGDPIISISPSFLPQICVSPAWRWLFFPNLTSSQQRTQSIDTFQRLYLWSIRSIRD